MDSSRLGRDDWLRAARLALLAGGAAAVRVERLAADLGVTKGSFYWHFTDRGALLEALLGEWEAERSVALRELPVSPGVASVRALMTFLRPRVLASERGQVPSDAAIFAWASSDEAVARRVNAAEAERVASFRELAGDPELGEFLYLAYLGFVMRRRRAPVTAAFFPVLARLTERLVDMASETADERSGAPSPSRRQEQQQLGRRPEARGGGRRSASARSPNRKRTP